MQSSSVQHFSKTLFVVALTICLVLGTLYLGAVLRWSPDSLGEFFIVALLLVVVVLALSAIAGLCPWLYRLTKTKVGHFTEMLQLRIARQIIRNRLLKLRIPMKIQGITNWNGTVAFCFQPPTPNIMTTGMHLEVITEHPQQRWGMVEIVSVEPNMCFATPFDRANEDFFASLEDRMNKDISPPIGVILVPTVSTEVEAFIYNILR